MINQQLCQLLSWIKNPMDKGGNQDGADNQVPILQRYSTLFSCGSTTHANLYDLKGGLPNLFPCSFDQNTPHECCDSDQWQQ